MTAYEKQGAATYSSAIEDADNYTNWVLSAFRRHMGRDLLEVGVGHGSYVDHLPGLNRYVGVDIDPDCVAYAQARHPRHCYQVADIVSPDLARLVTPGSVDTVLCCNVLEHVPDDGTAVRNLLSLLRPGGHLLVFVPALPALYAPMDRMAGHHRRYTRASMARLVPEECRIVRNAYFNPIGGLGWWVNKFLPHQSLNDGAVNWQVRVFDRWVLPLSRLVNPLTERFFGQSLVLVVQKP